MFDPVVIVSVPVAELVQVVGDPRLGLIFMSADGRAKRAHIDWWLRSERSEQAAAGVWGRSPQRGPGAEPMAGG